MRLYLLLIILIALPFALAQEETISAPDIMDDTPSYIYLDNNTKIKDLSTLDAALSLLALNNLDYNIESRLNEFIASGKSDGCWPKTGCTIIDTAFGLLVLDKTGQDTNKTISWFGSREIAAGSTGGEWIIQVVSTQSGTCTVECGSSTKTISVSKDIGWFKIDSLGCGSSSSKSRNYYVDCSNVGDPTMHISLIYYIRHSGYDESFLLQDEQVQQKDITVDNACFPKSPGSSACDLGSTLYATWILKELDEEVHTIPYLEEHLNEISQSPLRLALLYLITGSKAYADLLSDKQKPSGSWGDDVYTTSFVAYSLITGSTENIDSYTNATNWLRLKRDKKDFSWNHKIIDTAIALIALHSVIDPKYISLAMEEPSLTEDICNDGLDDDGDGLKDCADPDCVNDVSCLCKETDECSSDLDCDVGETCDPISCECISSGCSITAGSGCEENSNCLTGETCNPFTCECETEEIPQLYEICDNDEDDDSDGDIDCDDSDCEGSDECKSSVLFWLIILFLVLLFGGFFVFYYANYIKKGKTFSDFKNDFNLFLSNLFKKKPKKKTFEEHIALRERTQPVMQRPMQQQRQPLQYSKPKRENVDDELEKSLEEARKLLGK